MKIEMKCEKEKSVKEFENQLKNIDSLNYDKVNQDGFDGMQCLYYFLSLSGGTVAIKAIAEIILRIIGKNDVKSFKLNDFELKGYSAKDITKIIGAIEENKNK
ncbi:hypothetical protein [Clostridium butyricum]|uniref:hypothetical protein n=1 Tax=Clostridium butyricum TaxID=1492 RepID=UPI0011DE4C4B|nr:hypothetical protein [Clostridium butyricum]MCQ2019419.1 hypothetical protein [Clostridium butyricum]MCQ2023630.1 hypothetical protein [Clostridium butyricum]NFB73485.1 hypothetical protein [Clostridium butyricum]NFB90993.1 hypothetical protein [Clostridium butyricum]UTY53724.1 hypothetical protein HNS01_11690 [Clostridium butyricum]